MGEVGREANTLLAFMRGKAWVAHIRRKLDLEKDAELDRYFDEVAKSRSLGSSRGDVGRPGTRWGRYRSGLTTPNDTVLGWIDRVGGMPRAVFEIGPEEGGTFIPLWAVFDPQVDLSKLIQELHPPMIELRRRGAPFISRLEAVALTFMSLEHWQGLMFRQSRTDRFNPQTELRSDCRSLTLMQLAAVLTMWRLALERDECMAEAEHLVRHVLTQEGDRLLRVHDLHELLPLAFTQMEAADLLERGNINEAIELLKRGLLRRE